MPNVHFTLRLPAADVQLILRAFDLAEVQLLKLKEGSVPPVFEAQSDAFQLALLRAVVTSAFLRQGFSLGGAPPKRRRSRSPW